MLNIIFILEFYVKYYISTSVILRRYVILLGGWYSVCIYGQKKSCYKCKKEAFFFYSLINKKSQGANKYEHWKGKICSYTVNLSIRNISLLISICSNSLEKNSNFVTKCQAIFFTKCLFYLRAWRNKICW